MKKGGLEKLKLTGHIKEKEADKNQHVTYMTILCK